MQIDEDTFKSQKKRCTVLLKAFSIALKSDLVKKNADNPKTLFRITYRMLHRKEETLMPPHVSEHELANMFSNFFKQKIQNHTRLP